MKILDACGIVPTYIYIYNIVALYLSGQDSGLVCKMALNKSPKSWAKADACTSRSSTDKPSLLPLSTKSASYFFRTSACERTSSLLPKPSCSYLEAAILAAQSPGLNGFGFLLRHADAAVSKTLTFSACLPLYPF